jgi:hypothetical protein
MNAVSSSETGQRLATTDPAPEYMKSRINPTTLSPLEISPRPVSHALRVTSSEEKKRGQIYV